MSQDKQATLLHAECILYFLHIIDESTVMFLSLAFTDTHTHIHKSYLKAFIAPSKSSVSFNSFTVLPFLVFFFFEDAVDAAVIFLFFS